MITMATILSFKSMKNMNPVFVAISVLAVSLLSAMAIYKTTNSSWMAFVLILTFSSGMMTLFMYTASMSGNEKTKTKKMYLMIPALMMLTIIPPNSNYMKSNNSMKSFSNMMMIMIMATILISTMIALSIHGHHPNQTVSSSF